MTRAEFLGQLKAQGISQVRFAELTGISIAAVNHWAGPHGAPIPLWVEKLLSAWQRELRLTEKLKRAIERNAQLAAEIETKRD